MLYRWKGQKASGKRTRLQYNPHESNLTPAKLAPLLSVMDAEGEAILLKRQVETFYRVDRFITSIHNLEELLGLIMQEAEAAVEAEASCIALLDPSANCLRIEFASGEKNKAVRYLTLPVGQGILGQVAATNTPLLVDDARQDSRFDPSVDRRTGFTTRCILAVPILHRNELLGVLEVINKRGESYFTAEDARLLEVVAHQAAIAIENARLLERTVQAERLSVIGKMAASIIHDFKNPMSVIRGFAELLGNVEVSAEKRQTYSALVLQEIDRFVGMAKELLDYSRGDLQLQLQQAQVAEWLGGMLLFLREVFTSSKVEVATDFGYQGPAWMDPDRMRRVLINIASNARDAMPKGGTFTITTRQCGDRWELSLHDTGTGIPPQLRSRIFKPFVTFGKEHGTGLGLAIVREIVEAHGGTIQVQSKVSGEDGSETSGTTFIVSLPIYPAGCRRQTQD